MCVYINEPLKKEKTLDELIELSIKEEKIFKDKKEYIFKKFNDELKIKPYRYLIFDYIRYYKKNNIPEPEWLTLALHEYNHYFDKIMKT